MLRERRRSDWYRSRPGRLRSVRHFEMLSPKLGRGEIDFSVVIVEARIAVAREKQRPVKIDIISEARDNERWGHAQRSSDHAAGKNFESSFARAFAQTQRFGQPARLIELHVDHLVTLFQARKIFARMTTLVRADGHGMIERFKNFVGICGKRLF